MRRRFGALRTSRRRAFTTAGALVLLAVLCLHHFWRPALQASSRPVEPELGQGASTPAPLPPPPPTPTPLPDDDSEERRAGYCKPTAANRLVDMIELAERVFAVPHGELAPVSILPGRSAEQRGGYARSIEELERHQPHAWILQLEGSAAVANASALIDEKTGASAFTGLGPGWYCLSVVDAVDRCIIGSVPFAVLDGSRRGTEYAVRPYTPKSLLRGYIDVVHGADTSIANDDDDDAAAGGGGGVQRRRFPERGAESSEGQARPSVRARRELKANSVVAALPFLHHDVRLWHSRFALLQTPLVVAAGVPQLLERFDDHAADLTAPDSSRQSRLQHITLGDVLDLHYGRGSFWVLSGAAAAAARVRLSTVDAELAHEMRHNQNRKGAGADVGHTTRAPMVHYATTRHIALDSPDSALEHEAVPSETNQRRSFFLEALNREVSISIVARSAFTTVRSAAALMHAVKAAGERDPCLVIVAESLRLRDLSIERSCHIAFDGNVHVRIEGRVTLRGTEDEPLLLTAANGHFYWGGIIVAKDAHLVAEHVMVALVGSAAVPREKNTGSHIVHAAPAFTAVAGSTLVVRHSAVLNCDGSGFALGRAKVVIEDTLVQDVAQGGECVSCDIVLRRSHFVDVPYVPPPLPGAPPKSEVFVDGDNDAFYFRGGHAVVEHCVFLNTLDDGIDSAMSENDGTHTSLIINASVIANCLHEGLALSASRGNVRAVTVRDSLIAHCQQGIENGHSPATHITTIVNTVLKHNVVGMRNGDNYKLPVLGHVFVEDSHFVDNQIAVLDYAMGDHIRASHSAEPVRYHVHNPHIEASLITGIPAITVRNCFFVDSLAELRERGDDAVWASETSSAVPSWKPDAGLLCGTPQFVVDHASPSGQ